MAETLLDSRSDTAPGTPLVLRLLGEEGGILPLDGDKLTVGSGQSCTIRLAQPGVRPLACLITRGDEGLRVRRWADGTLLNGEPFTDAPLAAGDRLTLGPVELEVAPAVAECQTEPADEHAVDHQEVPASTQDPAILENLRGRTRRLLAAARGAQQRTAGLEAELAELRGQLAEVESERGELIRQRDDLAAQLQSLADELSAARGDLDAFRESQTAHEQEICDRLAELERQVAERTQLALDLQSELEVRQAETADDAARAEAAAREATSELADAEPWSMDETAADLQDVRPVEEKLGPSEAMSDSSAEKFAWSTEPAAGPNLADDTADGSQPADDNLWAARETAAPPEKEIEGPVEQPVDWNTAVEPTQSATPDEPAEGPTAESSDEDDLWGGPSLSESGHASPEATPPSAPEAEPARPEEITAASADGREAEEDLWGSADAGRSLLSTAPVSGPASEPVSKPREPVSERDLWDIERHPSAAAPPAPTTSDADAMGEAAQGDDLWGRLSTLRAAASEKLHSEVEPQAASLMDQTVEAPTEDAALMASGFAVEPEVERPMAAEPEEPSAEPGFALNEPLASPTTLFDAPSDEVEEAPTVAPHEPVSFVEKYKHLLEEDGEGGDSTLAPSQPVATPEVSPAPAAPAPAPAMSSASDDDESIEEYMAAMMARLRGDSTPAPAPQPAPAEKPAEPEKAIITPPLADNVEVTPRDRLTDMDLERLKSNRKPEQEGDLSQLRDLANSTAREAIHVANSRRTREKATTKMAFCALAGWSGAYLVWASAGQLNVELFAGAAAVATSAYWASRTLRQVTQAEKPRQPESRQEQHPPLPIDGGHAH